MKYQDVVIQPLSGNRFKILEAIQYKEILIPAGYITNGADIPRIFWAIFPPNKSDYLPAVIVHDYLCDQELYTLADLYFKEILELLEIDRISRILLVSSVRLYHKIRYQA